MELQDILGMMCIYNIIVPHLTLKDIHNLKLTNKVIYSILDNLGYLKDMYLEVDTFDKMMKTHHLYNKHKHYVSWVGIKKDLDPFSRIPKLGKNINLFLDNCKSINYNHSIKNISSVCLIDCKNVDLSQFESCNKLKTISIYNNNSREKINVSKITTFDNLETLIISGSINLNMIRSKTLNKICINDSNFTKGYYVNHFESLEFLFISVSYLKCGIITNNNLKFMGLVYNNILYWKQFIKNFDVKEYLDLINIFQKNCNEEYYWQYKNNLNEKKIDDNVNLFYLDKFSSS